MKNYKLNVKINILKIKKMTRNIRTLKIIINCTQIMRKVYYQVKIKFKGQIVQLIKRRIKNKEIKYNIDE